MHTVSQPKQQFYVGATNLFISFLVSVSPEWYLLNEYLMNELTEAVTLVTCSSEVTGLTLGQTLTILTEVFMVFLTLFR
jgi:hypothetical protein